MFRGGQTLFLGLSALIRQATNPQLTRQLSPLTANKFTLPKNHFQNSTDKTCLQKPNKQDILSFAIRHLCRRSPPF